MTTSTTATSGKHVPLPVREYRAGVHDQSRDIMTAWMGQLKDATRGSTPSAYLMISGNCVEILRCFDILPVFPEINALQLAIRKKSLPYILKAEEIGYASDNCAYVKADVGFTLSGGVGPEGNIPVPSLIVCNFVGCNVYIKWFEHCAAMFNAPLVMLDIPFIREDRPSPEDVRYVMAQLDELIRRCEALTGRKFDIDRLREICRYSARAEAGWSRCKELCKHRPAPFDAYFDSINMMGPINALRGTKEAADFFDTAVAEYEQMVAEGRGVLPEERFRIVTEGPPPYPYYRNFRNLFETWGAVAVQSTYSTVGGTWEFGFRHDPDRPLESIAEQMLVHNLCNRTMTDRYAQIRRYVDEWHADALVIHSIKSCRLFSAGQGDMREYFTRELGVPTLMLESDLEDPRYYAEAQMKNRIDAFFESLQYKRIRECAART
ncbi:MAG: 2-hydroxyacyl-CoA dehydratase family protein [Phycisphaerae bacterium]|nr:2-hydroxyacyl-CoA dehydratase family protein [Phycisphaerae bacterium]